MMVMPFDHEPPRRPIFPLTITFTGMDKYTVRTDDLERLAWHQIGANIEVAVLVCAEAHKSGWNRYPSVDRAHHLIELANDLGLGTAVHLCGAEAIAAATGGPLDLDIQALILCADRLQLNLRESHSGVGNLEQAYARFGRGTHGRGVRGCSRVIGQIRSPNPETWPSPAFGVDYLYDPSAGTGFAPPDWPTLPAGPTVSGYGLAGGIQPGDGSVDRAIRALEPKMRESNYNTWIDMETGVRSCDRFSTDLCLRVLDEAAYTLRRL